MINLNERITAAHQMMGERRLTAHALQTHNGVKHHVDRTSEREASKHRSMGSVTMGSDNFDRVDGTKSPSPVPPNPRHANIAHLQSPTELASFPFKATTCDCRLCIGNLRCIVRYNHGRQGNDFLFSNSHSMAGVSSFNGCPCSLTCSLFHFLVWFECARSRALIASVGQCRAPFNM